MILAKARALVLMAVTCLAVLSPLVPELRGRKNDSFPLSWYPMFASKRPRFEEPVYAFGWRKDGTRERLDVRNWTHGGFNQGRGMLATTVKKGPAATGPFCDKLAGRVAKMSGRWTDVVEVRIVKGRYDRETFFGAGDRTPLAERLIWSCPVERDATAEQVEK